ncbi:MAG: prolipoprotein diacylglyceryl transferase [Clostridia bacterium]
MKNYFTIGSLEIHYYGVIMASAMLIGIFLTYFLSKKRDVKKEHIFDLALIVLPLAVLCARAYYCIFSEHDYSFVEFWQINKGGLAIYGGVIGGFIGVMIFCLIRKKNILAVCDILVPALILGQALGRWGNFINQEAYGYAVTNPAWQFFPFSVYIEAEGAWHLATFFYESMWNLLTFVVLLITLIKCKNRGIPTALYLILYGIGRVFIEGLRTDSLYLGNTGIRVSQLVSGALILVGIGILIAILVKNRRTKEVLSPDEKV